jgi:hypothetical protein
MVVWYSLWSFVIFFYFGMFGPRKVWQPCTTVRERERELFSENVYTKGTTLFGVRAYCVGVNFFSPQKSVRSVA